MFNWRNLFGGGGAAKLAKAAGISARGVELLQQDLERYKPRDAALPERLLGYLYTGTDAGVLTDLANSRPVAAKQGLQRILSYGIRPKDAAALRKVFFTEESGGDASFYLRLARFYQAEDPGGKALECPAWDEAGLLWPGYLLREATQLSHPGHYPPKAEVRPRIGARMFEEMFRAEGLDPNLLVRAALNAPGKQRAWQMRNNRLAFQMLDGLGESFVRYPEFVRAGLDDKDFNVRVYTLEMLHSCRTPLEPFAGWVAELAVEPAKQVRAAAALWLQAEPAPGHPTLKRMLAEGSADQRLHAAKLLWHWFGEEERPVLQARLGPEKNRTVAGVIEELLGIATPGAKDVAVAREEDTPEPVLELPRAPAASPPSEAMYAMVAKINSRGRGESLGYWLRHDVNTLDLPPDLRTFAVMLQAAGARWDVFESLADMVLRSTAWQRPWLPVESPAVWPFFAEHPWRLEVALGLQEDTRDRGTFLFNYFKAAERENALRVLAAMPVLPRRFVPLMWELALGDRKTDRPVARRALDKVPGKEARIAAALSSGQGETRAQAADWLGRLGDPGAVPALRTALKKETRDAARGAMMQALETLGAPIEEFLDRAGLERQAVCGLAKGMPAALAWFPFAALPEVRWSDTGQTVAPEILRWFVVGANKLKTPEPNAVLRRYCSYFQPGGREAFGRFVLGAWAAQDLRLKHTAEEAQRLAAAHTQQHYAQYAAYAQQYTPASVQSSEDYHLDAYRRFLRVFHGSAIGQKGVLAVAGACSGRSAAPVVARYLKEWYGQRVGQCRALVQMLAWADDPAAIQLLLAVGARFRTKSVQQEAVRQIEALAERKNWTLDELADRTVPTFGFDENATLELSFGPRRFIARLDDHLTISLLNADGKTVASLPEPNSTDDVTLAKDAKARLGAARKDLKAAIKAQTDRLYEAMCIGRRWKFRDWHEFVAGHPIMGRLAQRLVWGVFEEDGLVRTFRPLADRTLTDFHHDAVTVPDQAEIRLAHGIFATAEDAAAWRQHLIDYDVEPLFVQFGEDTYRLPEERRGADKIDDFLGYIVEAFKLRARANKLGYTRGVAQDGGWFFEYRKTLMGAGLELFIDFSGSGLPEENRKAALKHLTFVQVTEPAGVTQYNSSGDHAGAVPLGQVPPVLLSECWNDLRRIAADGPGFAPDWEKQIQ